MRLIIISGLFLMVYASMTAASCSTNEYQCADGVTCIPNSQLCDSSLDCPAGDDEESTNCVVDPTACPNTCPEGQYLCTDCNCKTSLASCPNQISTESTTVKGSDPPGVVDSTACPNTCTEGQYLCTDCSCKTSQASCPNQISTESTTVKGSDPPEEEGFPVWAIILIVIAVIILVAVLGVIAYKKSRRT